MNGLACLRCRPRSIKSLPFPRSQYYFTVNGYRARTQATLPDVARRRRASSEAGEDDSGHITAGPNEGILFFDSECFIGWIHLVDRCFADIFPLKLQWLTHVPFLNPDKTLPSILSRIGFNYPSLALADPPTIINRALPETLPLKVTEVLPRVREGGAFVKFTYNEVLKPEELEGKLKDYLQENPITPWFNPLRRVRAYLVKGKPWIEDLYRLPSSRLKVEFLPTSPEASAAELTQETLFSLFRPYGKLADIAAQPSDSKVLPRYAFVNFTGLRFAVMAKNCMHGIVLPPSAGGGKSGTLLKLTFEPKIKAHWIRDWLFNHPRIVIPAVAAIVATITVAIFDPVRTFFIKMHVTQAFHLEGNKVWRWVRGQLDRGFDILKLKKRKHEDDSFETIWQDRQGLINQLRTWLIEASSTFIVVQGPRGAGKKALVLDQAVKDRPSKLVIDCKPIQEARGDSATIVAAAEQVGYRPVFSWMNAISSLIDLAAQGTIGTKTGFSETLDTQLAKIFTNTATALKQIALSGRNKDDKDAGSSDDEYLEAHPERRSVVVVDNFLHKSNESSIVYNKISEWAAALTTTNIAHVIFLTTDVSFSKSLSKSLPDRVFRQIVLGDCTPEVAKKFVLNHLDADADDAVGADGKLSPSHVRGGLGELDFAVQTLGGRLTDLEFLARRMRTGETPQSKHQVCRYCLRVLTHAQKLSRRSLSNRLRKS